MKEEKFFERNMKGGVLFVALFSTLFFGAFSAASAEETATSSKLVTFTVKIGDVSCENGTGVASVTLTNDPMAGGYYEVTGDMITKNNITLSRRVELPTGIYAWKGFANNGYTISGKSSGEFTVGKCPTAASVKNQTLQGSSQPSATANSEEIISKKTELSSGTKEGITSTSSPKATATSSSVVPTEKNYTAIISGLFFLAVFFGYFGFRNRTHKQEG